MLTPRSTRSNSAGARATKPSAAKPSHTRLMWVFTPKISWMTTRPLRGVPLGLARYPSSWCPSSAFSFTVSPIVAPPSVSCWRSARARHGHAAFHHEPDAPRIGQRFQVLERVALDHHEVGPLALLDRPDLPREAQALGGPAGRGHQGPERRESRRPQQRQPPRARPMAIAARLPAPLRHHRDQLGVLVEIAAVLDGIHAGLDGDAQSPPAHRVAHDPAPELVRLGDQRRHLL